MYELFSFYLQGGLIDVGFLGAAQIDRFGNINTTVIGDYAAPVTRLPGQRRRVRDRDQRPRGVRDHAPVEALVRGDRSTSGRPPATSAARRQSERIRREQGWLGRGPSVVVTDLGIWHFDAGGEMRLDSLHPGATLDDVRAATGWEVERRADARRDARADERGAAPHPRGARSGRRLHEVGAPCSRRPATARRLRRERSGRAPRRAG